MDLTTLWAMPIMQVGFLVFFTLDAWLHFWYNYWLLVLCLITGEGSSSPQQAICGTGRSCISQKSSLWVLSNCFPHLK